KRIDATKKIYVFVCPQFYEFPHSPHYKKMVSAEFWKGMLKAAMENVDGVIMWSLSTDPEGNTLNWDDSRVQEIHNATVQFINENSKDIKFIDYGNDDGTSEGEEPTEFHMYHSIKFAGTPADLSAYGLKSIYLANEKDLSLTTPDGNGILNPDVQKIENFALQALNNPDRLAIIANVSSWITDRVSNEQAMSDRFKLVRDKFKAKNSQSKLGFVGVGPTSMSSLRLTDGYVEGSIIESWFRYAAKPMRSLRPHADILLPTPDRKS